MTPKYSADGRPIDVDTDAGPDDAVRAEGFSIKGSAQLQERMLREKAELARRSRDD